MYISKRWFPGPEKDISCLEAGKRVPAFERPEKEVTTAKFSKVNTPRKGRSGAWSLEEACLKIRQAEGDSQAPLVKGDEASFCCSLYLTL